MSRTLRGTRKLSCVSGWMFLVEVALNVFLFRILIIFLYFGSHTHISCLGLIKQVIYFLYFRRQILVVFCFPSTKIVLRHRLTQTFRYNSKPWLQTLNRFVFRPCFNSAQWSVTHLRRESEMNTLLAILDRFSLTEPA